jgi:hypothetical protein
MGCRLQSAEAVDDVAVIPRRWEIVLQDTLDAPGNR